MVAKAEKIISNCVEEASESLVLVNKASTKKDGMWFSLTAETGLPSLYFDVDVHEDI